jgi:carbamoyltransferase
VHLTSGGSFELDLRFFRHHQEPISFQWSQGSPHFDDLFSSTLEQLLGPRRNPTDPIEQRHRDLAHSVQKMYEEAFFNILLNAQKTTGAVNLALAGGCAMNSVANGKVRRVTPFKRLYVQAAAGDAGGAIGAAFAVWHKFSDQRSFVMDHAYWGPEFSEDDIISMLEEREVSVQDAGCTIQRFDDITDLCDQAAAAVAEGKVLGWFQGRMEWGPRALGNRSIIGDPRRADMKEILNAKIKRRESFRPFAPSILDRAVSEWFEEDDEVPFMMQVFQVREKKRTQIPAVTHVDGSGRLQTVHKHTNPRYYTLIERFEALTGVPMVLNTSFNENEPVVCKPSEALDCFLRTNMDLLVLGNVMIKRVKLLSN